MACPADAADDALLAGATGHAGRALTAAWAGAGTLHLLVRRPGAAPRPHTRVHVVGVAALPAASAAFCTLGTRVKAAGARAAFGAVDYDAVPAFARAARAVANAVPGVSVLGSARLQEPGA
jgi:hypothetical protein